MEIIPILMYHSISSQAAPRFQKFVLPQAVFAEHVAYLAGQQYTPLTVARLAALLDDPLRPLPAKPVVLTFDDGFADFYTTALPVLQKYGFPATIFLATGFIGQTARWLAPEGEDRRPMLAWPQVEELTRAGIECGSHTHTHLHLDVSPEKTVRAELALSKDILEQRLQAPVRTFSYPFGHFTGAARQMVIEAGYGAACAVKNALSHPADDRFALARITIPNHTPLDRLADLLAGKGLPLASTRESWLVKGWRQYRRLDSFLRRKRPGEPA